MKSSLTTGLLQTIEKSSNTDKNKFNVRKTPMKIRRHETKLNWRSIPYEIKNK